MKSLRIMFDDTEFFRSAIVFRFCERVIERCEPGFGGRQSGIFKI